MRLEEIIKSLNARLITDFTCKDCDFEFGFASDLMSDVLRLQSDNLVLITGLANKQSIRTAEMADISCIVFARGKKISEEMLEIANENEITVLECDYSVFKTSGILFSNGLNPIY
jgi:predicted transcriptional regulator